MVTKDFSYTLEHIEVPATITFRSDTTEEAAHITITLLREPSKWRVKKVSMIEDEPVIEEGKQ